MISSFIAQTFAISDNYWMWNESNIIENLKNQIKREKCIAIVVSIIVTFVVTTMVTRMVTMIKRCYNHSN